MTDIQPRRGRELFARIRSVVLMLILIALALGGNARADSVPSLFASFAGNMNFTGTAQTLRTQSDSGNPCTVTTGTTTATLSGIPSGATISAAYLYWAGSSTNITTAPDYDVTFDGNPVSAASARRYTATYSLNGTNFYYFSGVADVTAAVSAKGNGTYSFAGLSVNTGSPQCGSSGVLAGWALAVIYAHPSEDFRVINVFEGFEAYRGSNITLNPSNFRIPVSPINGKHAYITWEGDVGNSDPLNGFSEGLVFNGTTLSDSSNPTNNQFNSVSNITTPDSNATYGVDFDVYDISPYLKAGQTSSTSVYSSGGDLVLLSAEIISVTNTPVADLSISTTRNTPLTPGQSASYTLNVSNNGPNAEQGPITVIDDLPAGLSYSSFSGSGWSCSAAGQRVTCTRSGSLANGASAAVTLNVAVASNAAGAKTTTASVTGMAFDNQSGNNTSTDTYTIAADLVLSMSRSGPLTPGSNGTYNIYVTNDGPSGEAGSVTVTDTLPSGLSYVSASGSGWACNTSGQTVTCTRAGSLPAGITVSLALTVKVAAAVSGAVTNTATVTGTAGLDGNLANNTASDSFVFSPFAYYAMDESSWGTILDTSGNGRNATRLGSSAPTGYPVSSPPSGPGSAIAGNPGTCGSGSIPNSSTVGGQGVNTGISINSIGNAGTIALWYRGNTGWNDKTDRMLFDGSANLGNNNTDKHFYLIKQGDGSLLFALEDSSGSNSTATSGGYGFAANTWHHIVVTWDLAANRSYIYLDGNPTPVATSTTKTNGTLGNLSTLYLGTQRTSGVGGTVGNYTTNSANGSLDEVYIFNTAISGSAITDLKNLAHPCTASVHHYELSLPSTSIACMPSTVTVKACADSSSPCTNPFAGASGQTVVLTASGGNIGASSGVVVFDATGTASTTLSYPTVADGTPVTVLLSGESTAATNPRQCCPDGVSCAVANSCTTTFNTAGFIFANAQGGQAATIPTQVAGVTSNTLYLRAVKTNTANSNNPTNACQAALTGTQAVSFGYQCNNPVSCSGSDLMSVNGGTSTVIARNDNGGATNGTPVSMSFDANGNAPFTFNYADVGQVSLLVSKTVNNATLKGTSNPFVVKPYAFTLSGIQQSAAPNTANPAAADAGGAVFVRAGENFSATVMALNAQGNATPNYGREIVPESVRLTPALVAPAGGAMAALSGTFGAFGNGVAGGVATGSAFNWSEVGIITLAPGVGDGDYLGAGDVGTIGSISAGSKVLTVASASGIGVGTNLTILGAGADGADLASSVTGISGNSITLNTTAKTTVDATKPGNGKVLPSTGNIGRFIPHHFGLTGSVIPRSDLPRTTGNMTASGNLLNVASSAGIAVNNILVIAGAGPNQTPLQATVTAVAGNSITLSATAGTAVSNAGVYNVTPLTGTIVSGSNTLVMPSAAGIAVNDTVVVEGAGAAGADLTATVQSIAGNSLTLSTRASTTIANAIVHTSNTQDGFTYMGEPMLLRLQVTAYNASEGITQNYAGPFSKLNAGSLTANANWFNVGCSTQCFGLGAVSGATGLTGRLSIDAASPPAGYWSAGTGYFSASVILAKPLSATADTSWGPFDALNIGGAPRDSDGVTLPGSGPAEGHAPDLDADLDGNLERRRIFTTKSRLGRIKLSNAHGSELLPLPIGVTAQHWNGSAFVTNASDSNSRFHPTDIQLGTFQKNLATGETAIVTPPSVVSIVGGRAGFTLARPSGGDGKYDGSVDLELDSAVLPYLSRQKARARFGVYKGNNQIIYMRENF